MNESGRLRGLAGEGAPFPADDDGPSDSWAARRLMRNAGAQPEWVDMRKEIEAWTEKIRLRVHAHRQWLHDRTRLLAELPADRILAATPATATRGTRWPAQLASATRELDAVGR